MKALPASRHMEPLVRVQHPLHTLYPLAYHKVEDSARALAVVVVVVLAEVAYMTRLQKDEMTTHFQFLHVAPWRLVHLGLLGNSYTVNIYRPDWIHRLNLRHLKLSRMI